MKGAVVLQEETMVANQIIDVGSICLVIVEETQIVVAVLVIRNHGICIPLTLGHRQQSAKCEA